MTHDVTAENQITFRVTLFVLMGNEESGESGAIQVGRLPVFRAVSP